MPLKPPIPPMEATSVDAIPVGPEWQYEPKWDGFRCLVFRHGEKVELQSKAGKPARTTLSRLCSASPRRVCVCKLLNQHDGIWWSKPFRPVLLQEHAAA